MSDYLKHLIEDNQLLLLKELEAIVTDDYVFFLRGPLSQWAHSDFYQDDLKFNCCEQYMMYQKAILFEDHDLAKAIYQSTSPSEQKKLGRKVKNFEESVWIKHRKIIVFKANFLKFSQISYFRQLLLATSHRTLVEVNPHDRIWGIGLGIHDPEIYYPEKWKGQNLLGRILMRVREWIG